MTGNPRLVLGLLGVAAVMFGAAPFVIDTAPYESSMGLVQRIFYFHFPAAMTLFVSAIVCGVASANYLWRRRVKSDHLALAAAELAVLFGAMVLVTGSLWARKAWGFWWVWEPRLTSALVMWMIFIAYLLLRRFGGAGSEALAAAVGLFGMVLVPFVYFSVNLWRTVHPLTTVVPTLPKPMLVPALFCWVAFTLLFLALLSLRKRLEALRTDVDAAYLALED